MAPLRRRLVIAAAGETADALARGVGSNPTGGTGYTPVGACRTVVGASESGTPRPNPGARQACASGSSRKTIEPAARSFIRYSLGPQPLPKVFLWRIWPVSVFALCWAR